MPATSEKAPERQPRNQGRTPAPLALRTSPSCGCREGFQNLAMVFFLIPRPGHRRRVHQPDEHPGAHLRDKPAWTGKAGGYPHR